MTLPVPPAPTSRPADHSALHRLDARVKVVVTLAYLLALTVTPTGKWHALATFFVFWLVAAAAARCRLMTLFGRSLLALPFLLASLTLLLRPSPPPYVRLAVGPVEIALGETALARFLTVVIRSWLGVLAVLLLLTTTRVTEVLIALRSLGVPAPLVNILNLTYRYLFLLMEEAGRLQRARAARSARRAPGRGDPGLMWRARVTGGMIAVLLARSLARSQRVYYAMMARGFRGELRTFPTPPPTRREILFAGALVLAFFAVALAGELP